jgi:hypothetical protein
MVGIARSCGIVEGIPKISQNKPSSKEHTMSIARFPRSQLYVSEREVVIFVAYVDAKQIECIISLEALEDHFGGEPSKVVESFILHRAAIEHIDERLIARQRFEADGSILIKTADC